MKTIKYSYNKEYPLRYIVNVHNDGTKSYEVYNDVHCNTCHGMGYIRLFSGNPSQEKCIDCSDCDCGLILEKQVLKNINELKTWLLDNWQPSSISDEIYYNNLMIGKELIS